MKTGSGAVAQLWLTISPTQEIDSETLDQTTRQLRRELLELDVESVDFVQGEDAPAGTKSAETLSLGALAVAVLPNLLPQLLAFLQSWTLRAEDRTIRIKTQAGDRSVEVEFNPQTTSQEDLLALVDRLTASLE